MSTVYAILGPMGGGTSCVAGVIHHLGISMGSEFGYMTDSKARCTYEDAHLHRTVCECIQRPHPSFGQNYEFKQDRPQILEWLGRYFQSRSTGHSWGMKHPMLPGLMDHLKEVNPSVEFIRVIRNPTDTIATMNRRWPWLDAEAHYDWVERCVSGHTCWIVDYDQMLDDPYESTRAISNIVGGHDKIEEASRTIITSSPRKEAA